MTLAWLRRPSRAVAVALGLCALVLAAVGTPAEEEPVGVTEQVSTSVDVAAGDAVDPVRIAPTARPRWKAERVLPPGGMLIAYYGTAGSGALGVLGETPPDRAHRRLARAAAPFERPRRPVRLVYELIVSIADAYPGRDGDYSHDIARSDVRRYVDAARENGALVVLDIQPGRSGFQRAAKRWAWALREPHVGLALDPEWRMGPGEVPGRVIGRVRAEEVNRVSAWLSRMMLERNLPEKVLVLHQFRGSMLPDVRRIVRREGLQLVQHVDGFGTPGQKLDTYDAVARPGRFAMGFKLFYDEDRPLMGARAVHRIRPRVRLVSYQ
ncbi:MULTISPECIES: hypothetical protein [Nocardioides]|uniref:Lipoprotein n=1 Tax=Nocardioides vastitatis TaxID=2568655 RepID=A0ABW0ZMF3_9ACTN|nr:hypothetical protein [Nocardioides sp.]THJ00002.1 hypothetical protein E7Z54_12205 [Nocardioides sp.]